MNKAVFLDRDGVLNYDSPNYVYNVDDYEIYPDVKETLKKLKEAGYLLIVITNQAGISRGLYTKKEMLVCYNKLNTNTDSLIDDIYYSPYHPSITRSLSRKPGTLMFEKAKAKWNIDFSLSWMIGDKQTDLEPAIHLGMKTIGVLRKVKIESPHLISNIRESIPIILPQ